MIIILKSFALFFLLQALGVFLASLLWLLIEKKIPKIYRARSAVFSVSIPILLSVLLTLIATIGTISGHFGMVTPFYVSLMQGGAETVIVFLGILSFISSTLASAFLLKEPKPPIDDEAQEIYHIGEIEVRINDSIPLAATFGVKKPVIAISAEMWRDKQMLPMVILHELAHVKLKHNLLKFIGRTVLRLNFFNPLAHALADRLDVSCEVEADLKVSGLVGVERYAKFLPKLPTLAFKHITAINTELTERLIELNSSDRGNVAFAFLPSILTSMLLSAIILSASSRCLTVCFLGY